MVTIINITENNGQIVVSARELYQFLGYDISNWSSWYQKNIVNNEFAIENEDFTELVVSTRTKDFALNIEFAKKLSMMARTEKGEEARQYFIDCEKQIKQPQLPQNYIGALEALVESEKHKEQLLKQISNQKAKIDFIDRVIVSKDTIDIGQCSKILDLNFGRNTLFRELRERGVFFKNRNEPKQILVEKGYFKLKEQFVETKDHGTKIIIKVLVTQRGLGYLSTIFNSKVAQYSKATLS